MFRKIPIHYFIVKKNFLFSLFRKVIEFKKTSLNFRMNSNQTFGIHENYNFIMVSSKSL